MGNSSSPLFGSKDCNVPVVVIEIKMEKARTRVVSVYLLSVTYTCASEYTPGTARKDLGQGEDCKPGKVIIKKSWLHVWDCSHITSSSNEGPHWQSSRPKTCWRWLTMEYLYYVYLAPLYATELKYNQRQNIFLFWIGWRGFRSPIMF